MYSKKDKQLYIGSTVNLKNRIAKHKKGFVKATKRRRPLLLIYCEIYLVGSDAKQRELFLKGGKGHQELKVQLVNTFKKIQYKYRY